ncbi:MAG: hypothetical protein PHX04_02765 [Bacilli bacterium]|nr:hypothetical protein [Bacilli bacterium]
MKHLNNNDEHLFTLGMDYDGVITKRGSSGLNEEKWLKREKNILWRKLLNFVSIVYNRFTPINEDAVELCKEAKEEGGRILIISSHILTTSNYKESVAARNRVRRRLRKENIPFDDTVWVSGDKVDACIDNDIDLMIEDNVDKVKALRHNGISTLANKTSKNNISLEHDPDAIDRLIEALPFLHKIIAEKKLINEVVNKIMKPLENNVSIKTFKPSKPKTLFDTFPVLINEPDFLYEHKYAFEMAGTNQMVKKLVLDNNKKNN